MTSFKTILKYFLIWQIWIIFVSAAAGNLFPLQPSDIYLGGGITNYLKRPLLNFRSNYDGVHYVLIATHGYNYGQQAFFPLYPNLIRAFRSVVADPIWGGVLISSACFLAGLWWLYRLLRLDHSDSVARWTIIALLAFPTSFFFSAVYTEGLFFLLVILSFFSARKSNWLAAGLFGALAAYTRLVGIFLLPALAIELWFGTRPEKRFSRALFSRGMWLLLVPLGLLIYMNYLRATTGDPLAFYHVQALFNQNRSLSIVMPYQVCWRYLCMLATVDPTAPVYYSIWLEFLTAALFGVLTVVAVFRQRFSYAVFSLLCFAVPTLTGNLVSLPRYILVCFPAFRLIGTFLATRPKFRPWILGLFLIIYFIFLSMFVRGYWVA